MELEVRPPSVTEILKKLGKEKLVNYERYGGVTLTDRGRKAGKAVKTRHDTLKKFLGILMVPERTAEKDACMLEHDLSPETIEQLTKFVSFFESAPPNPKWLEKFGEFCRTGEFYCEDAEAGK